MDSASQLEIQLLIEQEKYYRKIPKISPSMYEPLKIKAPQTGNGSGLEISPSHLSLTLGFFRGKEKENTEEPR